MQMFDKYSIKGRYDHECTLDIHSLAEWKKNSDWKDITSKYSDNGSLKYWNNNYRLLNDGKEICESLGLEIYKNLRTGEVRVVINDMNEISEYYMNKNVIISLSKNELRKYYHDLTKAVGDKITKLNKLFRSSSAKLTGKQGSDGYDISAQQIFIKDSKIYQPIDNERFYEIGDLNNLPKTVYLVRDKEQSNNYKPDDFLKGIERLKGVGNNDYNIDQIKALLLKCIDNVKREKSNSFVKVNYCDRECERFCSAKEIPNYSSKCVECSELCNNKSSNNYIYNDINNIFYGNYGKQQNSIYNRNYNNFRLNNLANYGNKIMSNLIPYSPSFCDY